MGKCESNVSEAVLMVTAGFYFLGRALRCKLRVAFCRMFLNFSFYSEVISAALETDAISCLCLILF